MIKKNITYLSVSDIHTGHTTISTERLIEGLNHIYLDNKKLFNQLDVFFIGGDITDRLLASNSKEYMMTINWLTSLLSLCGKYDVKVRILEGTPSHDWKQASALVGIVKESGIDVDFKYIDTVSVEVMPDLGLSVLYVPDEANDNPNDTLLEVKEAISAVGLTKVDLGIMHGQFPHQLPDIELHSSHNPDEYLKLVERYIHIGHIHKFSVFDRIISNGSFGRLAHNEEEAKGYVLGYLTPNGNDKFIFVENKYAEIFRTVKIKSRNINEVINQLKNITKKYKRLICLRLDIPKDNPVRSELLLIRSKVPAFKITLKTIKEKKTEETIKDKLTKGQYLSITPANISSLMRDEVGKHEFTKEEMNIFEREMREIIW